MSDYTKSLLHFDGTDGSKTFTDEAGLIWTPQGTATPELDTAQKYFGTASGLWGSLYGPYLDTPWAACWNLGNSNWTFECFIRPSSTPSNYPLLHVGPSISEDSFAVVIVNATTIRVRYGASNYDFTVPTIAANTWYHIGITHDNAGETINVYVNGTGSASNPKTVTEHPSTGSGVTTLGYDSSTGSFRGWIDEFRMSNTVRWTENFTPPTEPYAITFSIEDTFGVSDLAMSNSFDSIDDGLKLAEILSEKYPIDVEDILEMASRARFGFVYAVVTESFLDIVELPPSGAYHKTIDESIVFESLVDPGLYELIEEILTLTDSINVPAFIVLQDAIFIYDTGKVGWHKLVPETFNISLATGSGLLALMISEWLTIKDSQVNNWTGQEIMAETIAINSLPVLIQSSKQTIADTLAIADSPSWRLTLAILDVLGFTELQKAARYSQHQVSESLVLTDEARRGFENLVESVLSAIDASSVIGAFAKSLAESLDLADATSFITRVAGLVNESLVFSETASSAGKLYNIIRESLALNVLMELDGEIWECFVLNTPHFHPSIYSGYDFNSFCVFEGRAFGANEKGIYELTGSTDAGNTIHTGIIMKGTDFGTPNQKRFRRGYFGISGSSPVLILETESGQRQAYNIDTKGKTVASHELKSKSWTLSIADFQALESAILIPVVLSR